MNGAGGGVFSNRLRCHNFCLLRLFWKNVFKKCVQLMVFVGTEGIGLDIAGGDQRCRDMRIYIRKTRFKWNLFSAVREFSHNFTSSENYSILSQTSRAGIPLPDIRWCWIHKEYSRAEENYNGSGEGVSRIKFNSFSLRPSHENDSCANRNWIRPALRTAAGSQNQQMVSGPK